jgi:hypothetical protein
VSDGSRDDEADVGNPNGQNKGTTNNPNRRSVSTDMAVAVIVAAAITAAVAFGAFYSPSEQIYWQSHYNEISNPLDRTETMELVINLASTTFGAQDKVTAFVSLYADENRPHINGQNIPSDFYRVSFEKTFCDTPPANVWDTMKFCNVELRPNHNTSRILDNGTTAYHWIRYQGQADMYFSHGGDFNIYLSKEFITANITADTTQAGKPFIHIESVDVTQNYDRAQTTLFVSKLALIASVTAASFGGLNFYRRHKEGRSSAGSEIPQDQSEDSTGK